MSGNDQVIIKGVRDGLLILLDDSAAWPALLQDLDYQLGVRRAFFQGAAVTANLGARILDEPEFHALHDLLARFDMTLDVVVSTATQTRAVAGVNGVRNRAPAFAHLGSPVEQAAAAERATTADPESRPPAPGGRPAPRGRPPAAASVPAAPLTADGEPDFVALAGDDADALPEPALAAEPGGALFVRRSLRSGMRIAHDGDVCILGDVNAGAEVVAGGDVVVWGTLRGRVQAGAGGDTAAVVCALLLGPTQICIADVVSRGSAPGGPVAPEMARVVHGRILVEPWTGRRK